MKNHNFLTYVCAKYAAKWKVIPTLAFTKPGADTTAQEQEMLTHRHVAVVGWEARWYDLFVKYKQEIIDLFDFKTSVKEKCNPLLVLSKGFCRLGVHIRRGDYAIWHNGRYFFSDEQFVGVIKQFLVLHPATTVYICGNDPALNKEYYRNELLDVQVIFPMGNAAEDLYLLSQCDYLIGPPSTFSLTASLYRDTPLYWINDTQVPLTTSSFRHFDELFRQIL